MKTNRRGFLKGALLTLASIPVIESLLGNKAEAAEVDKTKGMAKTLGYVSNAATECAGGKCGPKYKAEAQCCSCSFYTKVDGTWGNCSLVKPGNVAAVGWCKNYAKKASVTKCS